MPRKCNLAEWIRHWEGSFQKKHEGRNQTGCLSEKMASKIWKEMMGYHDDHSCGMDTCKRTNGSRVFKVVVRVAANCVSRPVKVS